MSIHASVSTSFPYLNIFMDFLNFAEPYIFEKEKMDKRCIDARSVKCEV